MGSAHGDRAAWIDCWSGEVRELDLEAGEAPALGTWHLFSGDVEPEVAVGDVLDADVIEAALERRREYEPGCDLSMEPVEVATDRELSFIGATRAEEQRRKRIFEELDIPRSLSGWAGADRGMREKMLAILEVLEHDREGYLTTFTKSKSKPASRSPR